MKPSEIRDRGPAELAALEKELRDQLLKQRIARATQQNRDQCAARQIRRDIARVKTIARERELGLERGG
jgi:large subunit ribosomal protein L29